jgi:hypothetical protein
VRGNRRRTEGYNEFYYYNTNKTSEHLVDGRRDANLQLQPYIIEVDFEILKGDM